MNRIGRRWSLAGSLLLCSFTCAAGGFVHHGNVYKSRPYLNLYIWIWYVNHFISFNNFIPLVSLWNYYIYVHFCTENTWAVVSLFLLGKLGITSAFATSYVHTAEMLPTVVRSMGVGSASTVARLGALIAPFVPLLVCSYCFSYILNTDTVLPLASIIISLSLLYVRIWYLWVLHSKTLHAFDFTRQNYIYRPLPLLLFGGVSLLAGLLALMLPETFGQKLPDTVS